uniref:Uncharacterized protein n=1 Tax=Gossypium raimondii TaxID=29730 RepID=A0A0D2M0Q7_GOSRA|nr:hypothetical protein B456_001G195800 [Gossypium raimondii]
MRGDPPHLSTWGPSHFSISLRISPFQLIHCINNWCGQHGSNPEPEEFAVISMLRFPSSSSPTLVNSLGSSTLVQKQ